MSRKVGVGDRVLDYLALALLLGGAVLYFHSWSGMRSLGTDAERARNATLAAPMITDYERYHTRSRVGLGVGLLGAAVGVFAFIRHRRAR